MAHKNNGNGVEEISGNSLNGIVDKQLAVIDFFAEWCMPCLMMAPIVEELSEKMRGKAEFFKANVDENQELARKFKVMSIPTLIILEKGKEKERIVGSMPADVIEEKIGKFVK